MPNDYNRGKDYAKIKKPQSIHKDLKRDSRGQIVTYDVDSIEDIVNSVCIICDTLGGELPRNHSIGNRALLGIFEWMSPELVGFLVIDLRNAILNIESRIAEVYISVGTVDSLKRTLELNIKIKRKGNTGELIPLTRTLTGYQI